MKAPELIEMLQNCYEDADVTIDISPYGERDIESVEFDDVENKAYITTI